MHSNQVRSLEKFTRWCTSPVNGEGLKLEMDWRLAHLQEGTSHLGWKQQLREQKTVAPSTCPKHPRESPIDKPERSPSLPGLMRGCFRGTSIRSMAGRIYHLSRKGAAMHCESACPELLA